MTSGNFPSAFKFFNNTAKFLNNTSKHLGVHEISTSRQGLLGALGADHVTGSKPANLTLTLIENLQSSGFLPWLIVVGILGGVLSLAAMFKKDMREFSFVHYLMGNAFANVAHLFCLGELWMESRRSIDILRFNVLFQLFVLLTHASRCFSVWSIVTSGADNCVRLCWPWLVPEYTTTTRSKEVLWATFVTVTSVYLISMWSDPISRDKIEFSRWSGRFSEHNQLFSFVDALMTCAIPLPVSAFFTARLAFRLFWCRWRDPSQLYARKTVTFLFVFQLIFLTLFSPGSILDMHLVMQSISRHTPLAVHLSADSHPLSTTFRYFFYIACSTNFFVLLAGWKLFRCSLRQICFHRMERFHLPKLVKDTSSIVTDSRYCESHTTLSSASFRQRVTYRGIGQADSNNRVDPLIG